MLLKTGWLNIYGELIECNSYEHVDISRKLARQLGFVEGKYKLDDTYPMSSDDFLMAHKYVYIGKSAFNHSYRIRWKYFLTEYQKNFLKTYFSDENTDGVDDFSRIQWEKQKDEYCAPI